MFQEYLSQVLVGEYGFSVEQIAEELEVTDEAPDTRAQIL